MTPLRGVGIVRGPPAADDADINKNDDRVNLIHFLTKKSQTKEPMASAVFILSANTLSLYNNKKSTSMVS